MVAKKSSPAKKPDPCDPKKILAIDIGGTKVKILLSGENEPRKAPSGKKMTPAKMVEAVRELAKGWEYDAVSIGYPGLVGDHGPQSEPGNLGSGWVGFNFSAAFDRPVRIINDAAMQALGSYDGGRMLFLGLGTGLGSTFIADNVIVPMELGRLSFKNGDHLGEILGRKGLESLGKDKWREAIHEVVGCLMDALVVNYVVVGGGNSKYVGKLPPNTRLGHNQTAFRGGFRLWNIEDVPTLTAEGAFPCAAPVPRQWRLI